MERHHVNDRSYIDDRVAALGESQLREPVRLVLDDPSARLLSWTHEPFAYDFLNPSSGGVYRVAGTAEGRGGVAEWRLVLKVTRSPESLEHDSPLPPGLAHAVRWDRELHAYESGFLGELDGDLVAPRSYGGVRHDDETAWLWLEDLSGSEGGFWSVEDYGRLGRALGLFNGRYLANDCLPDGEWLGERWLRTWVSDITPPAFGGFLDAASWDDPAVRAAYPPPFRERLLDLWAERERLLAAVEALPRTCCHLDAHRRNLFERDGRLVAIDWGLLGLAPPGEEIAATLVGTVASGELPAEETEAVASLLYDGYVDGLRAAGWEGAERDVRLAFATAAGLRSFSVLGLGASEEQLARFATLAGFLLDLGDEARALA